MTWLSAIASALAILRALTEYLRDQKVIDGATADALLKGYRDGTAAITKARAARQLVRADAARNPAGVSDDDGFRRD